MKFIERREAGMTLGVRMPLFALTVFMTFSGVAQESAGATQANEEMKRPMNSKKVLVAFYSWSGNTREAALQIQKAVGGDLFEIQPLVPYPADYREVVEQAKREIKAGRRPELKGKAKGLAECDVVFIGSPNWWSAIAPPVATFLTSGDFSGKTLVPFITHGGGGMASCAEEVKRLCPKANVLPGRAFRGSSIESERDAIAKWADETMRDFRKKQER